MSHIPIGLIIVCVLYIMFFEVPNDYIINSDIIRIVDYGKVYFFYVALLFDLFKW